MADTVSCVLPAYGLSRDEVLGSLKRLPGEVGHIVVVCNDASIAPLSESDLSGVNRSVRILTLPFQVGKSEAVRCGIESILEDSCSNGIITQIDGDLKQPPEDLEGIIHRLKQGTSAMVIGNRYGFPGIREQIHRVAAVKLVSSIVTFISGFRLIDTLCGMRGYRRELAEHFLRLRSFGYGLEIEQILLASKSNYWVENTPVHSKLQDEGTNAEKIEDNLSALICYCSEPGCSASVRAVLNNALAMVKRRVPFEVDLGVFGSEGIVRCECLDKTAGNKNAYASGTCRDGYSFNLI